MGIKRRSTVPPAATRPLPVQAAAHANHLLGALPADDCDRFAPLLDRIPPNLKQVLHRPGESQDRVERHDFPLTREFVAMMLAATRPTVTVVAGTLQRSRLITLSQRSRDDRYRERSNVRPANATGR